MTRTKTMTAHSALMALLAALTTTMTLFLLSFSSMAAAFSNNEFSSSLPVPWRRQLRDNYGGDACLRFHGECFCFIFFTTEREREQCSMHTALSLSLAWCSPVVLLFCIVHRNDFILLYPPPAADETTLKKLVHYISFCLFLSSRFISFIDSAILQRFRG